MKYRLQSMHNHMVGRAASVISPFYSILIEILTMAQHKNQTSQILNFFFKLNWLRRKRRRNTGNDDNIKKHNVKKKNGKLTSAD